MPYEEPTKPETPDYYFDLGVTKDATKGEIKRAFHNLALLHHPDKKASGESIDAAEFPYEVLTDTDEKDNYDVEYLWLLPEWTRYRRKMRDWEKHLEAERLLKETEELVQRRAAEEHELRKEKAEAERRRKEEAMKQRQATEDHETRRGNFAKWAYHEAKRLKQEAEKQEEEDRRQQEYEDMVRRKKAAEEQDKKAEEQRRKVKEWAKQKELNREEENRHQRRAARNQRRQARGHASINHGPACLCMECVYDYWHERPTYAHRPEWEYLHRAEEVERASKEAAQRARDEMDRKAKERLEKQIASERKKQEREQQARDRTNAAKVRAADKTTQAAAQMQRQEQEKMARIRMASEHIQTQQLAYLSGLAERGQEVATSDVVIDLGWIKKKGVAECLFCGEAIKYYSFHCPEGGAVACNPCKSKLSQFTPISAETLGEDIVIEGLAKAQLKDDGSHD